MPDERLLKLPEVSTRLGLSRSALYRLMRRGLLPSVHIGGALRFPASGVDRLIEDLKGATHAEAA